MWTRQITTRSISSFFLEATARVLCFLSSSNSASISRTWKSKRHGTSTQIYKTHRADVSVKLGLHGLHVDLQTQFGVLCGLQLVLQLLQLSSHLLYLLLQRGQRSLTFFPTSSLELIKSSISARSCLLNRSSSSLASKASSRALAIAMALVSFSLASASARLETICLWLSKSTIRSSSSCCSRFLVFSILSMDMVFSSRRWLVSSTSFWSFLFTSSRPSIDPTSSSSFFFVSNSYRKAIKKHQDNKRFQQVASRLLLILLLLQQGVLFHLQLADQAAQLFRHFFQRCGVPLSHFLDLSLVVLGLLIDGLLQLRHVLLELGKVGLQLPNLLQGVVLLDRLLITPGQRHITQLELQLLYLGLKLSNLVQQVMKNLLQLLLPRKQTNSHLFGLGEELGLRVELLC
ncbi:hypothetical protein EYF80_020317 [Liparis tanakae]|uniref:Transmembrane protein n=1 Tax=Liparis tanakae TaxID=230148 RepID=A0A4Z2HWW6_9TELE|nr:hypothetical protein EYF80_020317 [Liparis tanakae]